MADAADAADAAFLGAPPAAVLTDMALFVCTYVAKLDGLNSNFQALTQDLCRNPHGPLVAVNSNFGHACQPGYEAYVKSAAKKKVSARQHLPRVGRTRRAQGDGTCFNSAVEPVFVIALPGVRAGKVYKVKCFPTTGETQVPGVILPDLSDGHEVLATFVQYLNELAGGVDRAPIAIASEQPKMLNYKFMVNSGGNPRFLVDLPALARYAHALERHAEELERGAPLPPALAGWALVLPPYRVRETKPPTNDTKTSFRFAAGDRQPRVNIFPRGKLNILGASTQRQAEDIYGFFVALFRANWPRLVCLEPRRDAPAAAAQ